jgi:ABC-type uncharacterized transport system substrate-binding protein
MHQPLMKRFGAPRTLATVLAALATVIGAGQAAAHPHVFIEARTTVLYEGGTFKGLEHRWTFDEFYTESAIEGLDTNKDGVYDRAELAELAKVNIEGLKEFAYFTFPSAGGKDVKLAEVKDYYLEHKAGALTLVFTLPFEQPVPAATKDFRFGVADPTFFIGFEWAKTDAVKISDNAPNTCKVTVGTGGEEPPKSDEAALRGAFAQQFGNGMVSADRTVSAICPPG